MFSRFKLTSGFRLRELDFLRGIAIILVLMRHQKLSQYTENMGWIGVDLFFTLSGFLVSGILFKEYLKCGEIKPFKFLIRRAFKIYPLYYLTYIFYLLPLCANDGLKLIPLLGDLLFVQNYVSGWGYSYSASWSLAVEEHFYIGLSFFAIFILKYPTLISFFKKKHHLAVPVGIMLVFLFCLSIRLLSNIYFPDYHSRNFTMTHLRIDSLLSGVMVSYLYYFKMNKLLYFFDKYRYPALLVALLCIAWTPFIDPVPSFFVKTFGFTLLYVSFSIILIYFLAEKKINRVLDSLFTVKVVNVVSLIGYSSYSIYLIHTLVINHASVILHPVLTEMKAISFIIISVLSILIGFFMTFYVENYFLSWRDKLVPRRY